MSTAAVGPTSIYRAAAVLWPAALSFEVGIAMEDDDLTLAEWSNAAGNIVRVRLVKYRGHHRVDIREWYHRGEKLLPGRKGIGFGPRRLRKLARAIRRAQALLRSPLRKGRR